MSPDFSKKIEITIETLCKQGCSQVNQIIDDARNGNNVEELSDFTQNEIKQIIDELSRIMSVYENNEHTDD